MTVLGLVLVIGAAVGVQAAIGSLDGGEDAPSEQQAQAPSSAGAPTASESEAPQVAQPNAFPGRPSKKSGLRAESGLSSGLGKDAGDLAAKAQGLIDSEGSEKEKETELPPFDFRVSSYNILGAAHTSAGGNKPGYASGERRMGAQVAMIRGQGVDR